MARSPARVLVIGHDTFGSESLGKQGRVESLGEPGMFWDIWCMLAVLLKGENRGRVFERSFD
jgi:hypothetical protein